VKKSLLAIRRVVAPERDVLNVLVRRESPVFDGATIVYFQDIYDHLLRVLDAVDTYRDLMSSALDSYLSVTSNRLNQVMKTLPASSIVLMSMTLVASIYGMNFDNIPESHWRLGYYGALALMVLIGAGLGWVFRRIDWL
jgi:magnesium transporter